MTEGRTLAGRYRLDELLGRGGMGQVWRGWDPVLERTVAVKLMSGPLDGADGPALFLREARLAGALSHAGIVAVYDLGQSADGTLYLVMEMLTGRDLARVLREDGRVRLADVLHWATQICAALECAHTAGVIHRDLKPANLLLTQNGVLKILDFGIARYSTALSATASAIIGTVAYMPPERLRGRLGDARGDLYSLGCVLYELLTGDAPFGKGEPAPLMLSHLSDQPVPPSAKAPDAQVPAALDRLVLDLLAKNPDDRPESAAAVSARLREARETPNPPSTTNPSPGLPAGATAPQWSHPSRDARGGRSPHPADQQTVTAAPEDPERGARLVAEVMRQVEEIKERRYLPGHETEGHDFKVQLARDFPAAAVPLLLDANLGFSLLDPIARHRPAADIPPVLRALRAQQAPGSAARAGAIVGMIGARRTPNDIPRILLALREAECGEDAERILRDIAALSSDFISQVVAELTAAGHEGHESDARRLKDRRLLFWA
ncbi:protein kinase [Streptomyces griseoincarnatus]